MKFRTNIHFQVELRALLLKSLKLYIMKLSERINEKIREKAQILREEVVNATNEILEDQELLSLGVSRKGHHNVCQYRGKHCLVQFTTYGLEMSLLGSGVAELKRKDGWHNRVPELAWFIRIVTLKGVDAIPDGEAEKDLIQSYQSLVQDMFAPELS